jgi:hypothetical protein
LSPDSPSRDARPEKLQSSEQSSGRVISSHQGQASKLLSMKTQGTFLPKRQNTSPSSIAVLLP